MRSIIVALVLFPGFIYSQEVEKPSTGFGNEMFSRLCVGTEFDIGPFFSRLGAHRPESKWPSTGLSIRQFASLTLKYRFNKKA